MRVQDLHDLPKLRDGWSYLYVEHCKIEQDAKAVALHDAQGKIPVPCANLALLMIGPGVSISHAAVSVLVDHGCLLVWCGENGVRFYASGNGETRNAANLLQQAGAWADPDKRMAVVRNLYQLRFSELLSPELTLQQIRGMEGARVRDVYACASRDNDVPWHGRSYERNNWRGADPVNRALSAANACLYGLCHAAIVSAGFSPGIGFIHTGKMLSFVYDVADLYKTEVTIPMAFEEAGKGSDDLERRVRMACREGFAKTRFLKRIIPDIQKVLGVGKDAEHDDTFASDAAAPGGLWDPVKGVVSGGKVYEECSEPKGETS